MQLHCFHHSSVCMSLNPYARMWLMSAHTWIHMCACIYGKKRTCDCKSLICLRPCNKLRTESSKSRSSVRDSSWPSLTFSRSSYARAPTRTLRMHTHTILLMVHGHTSPRNPYSDTKTCDLRHCMDTPTYIHTATQQRAHVNTHACAHARTEPPEIMSIVTDNAYSSVCFILRCSLAISVQIVRALSVAVCDGVKGS
jgi:hypothetical protein